jgi:predicted TIM-barrel fold metal-dependent hydrolase
MIVAIDTHVHIHDATREALSPDRSEQMSTYFKRERRTISLDEMADDYRSKNMMCVLVNGTDITVSGRTPLPNDHVADAVKKHPDVYLGMGVVDPRQGKVAVDEVRRIAEELGLQGVGELNPARQHFFANDPELYPLWAEIASHDLPVLFHTGMAAAGAGTPGGRGVKLKYTRPIPYLDDIAADFPELTVIGAHPSWPYTDESLAIALHKSNYFVDLSGWSPKYFPASWVHEINSRLQDKALFGSDYPSIDRDRWLQEFELLPLKDEVRPKILLENARRVFKLSEQI